ncbi:hypothetical protein BJX63DRAFT_435237 [Aspergillus granulosus]|uniref:Nucleoside phosphorylase domain-containing protein n=1 Tax=Aspergillus granulosus TaxID=176169 RepID=A0ABR4H3I5_9EURO
MKGEIFPLDESIETIPSHQPKRQKAFHHGDVSARHDHYTIAWICALYIEMAAARAMLDDIHEPVPKHADDSNTYVLGSIKQHNVVIVCLPHGQYGTNNAAIVATNMLRTFKTIRVCLMVGIGGGVPSRADVRLGDVVVGTRVMQCDLGKLVRDGQLLRTAIPRIPHLSLSTAVSALRSKHELSPSRISDILRQMLGGQPAFGRPDLADRLFCATYDHKSVTPGCDGCDQSKLLARSPRRADQIMIHYGAIASGNQVMRSGTTRDDVARQLDVICFEMETAGLIDILPCIPIRGICDYSDSHKSKEWQRYAAATAAAYAREFLDELPVTEAHANNSCTHDSNCNLSDKRRQQLLDSLSFEQSDSRKMNIKAAHSKTCQWFLSNYSFNEWLDPAALPQHHGFLWVSGKPGAGKSTIMKFAYERMKEKAQLKNTVTASFFFNARGEYLEKSIVGMYRSLLLQLLKGYPDLQTALDDLELAPQSLNGCPPLNSLKGLFYKSVSALGQREFTCFVDALDECDEQQVADMVQFFEDLTERVSANGVPFRICFSSRHYPYIVIRRGVRLILEDQPGHAEDLETYVASRLQIDNPSLAKELQFMLLDKAAGVFMWVVLVVEILNKENRHGGMFLKKRLAEIPGGLSELFKDILRRDSEDMESLLLCVLWILYAKRPLQPREFYHALWSGLSLDGLVDSQIPEAALPHSNAALNQFDRFVIHSSKGLAEVTKSKKPTVQFIHESVRDFLVKDKGLYELWPELGLDYESLSHEKLKRCCCLYTNHTLVVASVNKQLSVPNPYRATEILNRFPFLEYANQCILYHANIAAKLLPQEDFLSSFRLSNWIKIHNAFEKFKIRRYTKDASLVYVLADNGHSDLVPNGNKDTVAAILNLTSCVYEGLDLTEGLDGRKDFKGYKNRTPLSWAAQNGRDGIVQLLIQNGSNVNGVDEGGQTPLLQASANGHGAVVRVLIEKGAEINATDKDGRTPLLWALEKNHLAVAGLLIERGAEVNISDEDGLTPLLLASTTGHEAVVRLLIERGAEVNATSKSGRTPLRSDLDNGHEALVRLLVDKGAEVNGDEDGLTPLLWLQRGATRQ